MFSPSLQIDFYDPVSNLEIPLYNGFILSLFFLICRRLVTMLVCSDPIRRESIVDIQLIFAERRVFASTCFTVVALCCPRLVILYTQNPDSQVGFNLPVTAYQWYWTIRWEGNETELYITQLENVKGKRNPYLLETSDCRVVPIRINTTFYVTSNDVLHAFSLPRTFSKCDAVPRRLNAISISFPRPRIFYRQCSELCRVGHSYIPIKVEAVLPNIA